MRPDLSSLALVIAAMGSLAAAGCGRGPHASAVSSSDAGAPRDASVGAAEAMAPLPAQAGVDSERFSTADRCALCHAGGGAAAIVDEAGRDVSPYRLWRSSMMAFSGRDPYWYAAVSHEIAGKPGARATIEATCTRCHAPEGAVERAAAGGALSFDDLAAGTSVEAHLGREGVGCTLCHQIEPDDLGEPSSFTGNFTIGAERLIYGPHEQPFPNPMRMRTGYVPTYAPHVTESGLCATCHTVITRAVDDTGQAVGPEVAEQAPYLEWENSAFAAGPEAVSCAGCHMPTTDQDGHPISTRISNRPPWLSPRSPFGRHTLAGGNTYMLGLLAENAGWAGIDVPAAEILEAKALAASTLRRAATISIESAARAGGELVVGVAVHNHAGHKFPTGYPSRRAWIRLEVRNGAGEVVFASGRWNAEGALVGAAGERLDGPSVVLPHRDEITSEAEVQVYEAVMADASGAPTHALLDATGFAKDNRLLPAGWDAGHPNTQLIAPVGIGADPSWGPATDTVTYRVPAPPGPLQVTAELLFQSVPASVADVFAEVETPAAVRFTSMMRARPPAPELVASAGTSVP